MPAAVPVPLRQRLVELADKGLGAAAIADRLGIAARTARRLLAQRHDLQAAGYRPAYHRCGRAPHVCQPALDQRREHPTWGAPYIRVVLQELDPQPVPSTRTLQRHLLAAGLQPAPPGRRPSQRRPRAVAPHAVWQLDACEGVPLRGGQLVSWVRVVDECSGAFLGTRVFPPRVVPTGAAPADAGLPPGAVRPVGPAGVAPGGQRHPVGASGGWPTALQLWAAGLGVATHHDPCRPQQNGVIENSQGTNKRWDEPDKCDTPGQLQLASDEAARRQREQTVELAFADQKEHRGLRRVRSRGVRPAGCQVGLLVVAHNGLIVEKALAGSNTQAPPAPPQAG